eukprot:scaffold287210_cov36-Prasinocladus_malaysianus.AAC.1
MKDELGASGIDEQIKLRSPPNSSKKGFSCVTQCTVCIYTPILASENYLLKETSLRSVEGFGAHIV